LSHLDESSFAGPTQLNPGWLSEIHQVEEAGDQQVREFGQFFGWWEIILDLLIEEGRSGSNENNVMWNDGTANRNQTIFQDDIALNKIKVQLHYHFMFPAKASTVEFRQTMESNVTYMYPIHHFRFRRITDIRGTVR